MIVKALQICAAILAVVSGCTTLVAYAIYVFTRMMGIDKYPWLLTHWVAPFALVFGMMAAVWFICGQAIARFNIK